MDLLEQEISKSKKTGSTKKNIVLVLLILCILAFVGLLILINVIQDSVPAKDRLFFNGAEVQLQEGLILTNETGTKYISLELSSNIIGYKYFNGEYGKNEEDKNKCYFQNSNEIIGFELDANNIYKIDLNANIGRQKVELKNKIIKDSVGNLYIALEDFSKACNVIYNASEEGKKIELATCEYTAQLYSESIGNNNKYTSINNEYNNLKAIYFGMLIVSDGSNYGVVDEDLKTIIGTKYKSIVFNEYTQNFIALSNNKYGVLSADGKVIIEFKYDSIRLLNYKPLLYEVKQNNKYGVLDDKGNVVIDIEYDKLGNNNNSENDSILIVENINNKEDGMVVYKNGKIGLVSTKTGETILNCELDNIYSKTLDNKITYYVKIQDYEYELKEYIKYANTTTVNLPNE